MKKNKTDLTLSMDDKIYLAVSKELAEKLSFVYTLACLKQKQNSNMYNMFATREIHAFRDKNTAELYHDTIEKIIEKNTSDKSKQVLFSANDKLIEQFYENSR